MLACGKESDLETEVGHALQDGHRPCSLCSASLDV